MSRCHRQLPLLPGLLWSSLWSRLTIKSLIICVMAAGIGGCSTWLDSKEDQYQGLWRSKDFFVRIEPQDKTAGKPSPNQHPINIGRDQLRHALSLIQFRHSKRYDYQPLFTEDNRRILGTFLEEGLAQAAPNQDITFAVESWHRYFLGLRSSSVLTGRVFYADGKLNLILGKIRPTNDPNASEGELKARRLDIRLHPYVPGLRGIEAVNDVSFNAQPGSGVFRPKGLNRKDWFVFTSKAWGARPRLDRRGNEPRRARPQITPQRAPAADPAIIAEKRLRALKNLREKGLIGEEEYERKRQSVLADL